MKKFIAALILTVTTATAIGGCGSGNNGAPVTGPISVVSREDGSGTRGAFTDLFQIVEKDDAGNRMDYTTVEAIIGNGTEIILSNVSGDPNAIGYVSLGSLSHQVKALKIDGTEPTAENIKSGTYKISRPFNIATKGTPSDAAQDFINFILSQDGQQVVEDTGYIAYVDNAEAFEDTGVTGKVVISGSSSVTPVMEKLKEAYQKINSDVDVEINQSDSTSGLQAALNGTSDIGMASRELKDSESALTPTVIAMDGIVIIVNNENAVDNMTPDEVRAIFKGEITEW